MPFLSALNAHVDASLSMPNLASLVKCAGVLMKKMKRAFACWAHWKRKWLNERLRTTKKRTQKIQTNVDFESERQRRRRRWWWWWWWWTRKKHQSKNVKSTVYVSAKNTKLLIQTIFGRCTKNKWWIYTKHPRELHLIAVFMIAFFSFFFFDLNWFFWWAYLSV